MCLGDVLVCVIPLMRQVTYLFVLMVSIATVSLGVSIAIVGIHSNAAKQVYDDVVFCAINNESEINMNM